MNIPLDKIIPNPEQPRKTFEAAEIESLAASIQAHGLINPISVESADDCYILIDGERRWRAAKLAGLETIEASVRPAMNGTGQRERLVMAIVANVQRSDMNPVEQAQAFWKLRQQGLSTAEIARQVSLSQSMVIGYINLLDLDDEIRDLIQHRELPFDFEMIKSLRGIEDPDRRVAIAKTAAQQKMSGPAICRMVKRMRLAKTTEPVKPGPKPKQTESKLSKVERIELSGGRWNMIAQLGYRPAVPLMAKAAEDTCRDCPLYDTASQTNCRDCPAVDLLRRLTYNG